MATQQDPRAQLRNNLLKKNNLDVVHFFTKYRKITEDNPGLRQMFYMTIKQEIMHSLNNLEKFDLLQEIQGNIYSNRNTGYILQVQEVSSAGHSMNRMHQNNIYVPQNNQNINGTCPIYINAQPTDVDVDSANDFDYFGDLLLPRGGEIISSVSPDSDGISGRHSPDGTDAYSSSSGIDSNISNSIGAESPNCNDELLLIENLFGRLTDCINNDEDVKEEFENIKLSHGSEAYLRTIKHIPKNDLGDTNHSEPIMFQLANKFDKYESALDKLLEDNLLNLDQKNQFNMTIYNVLLIKDFSGLCKLLSYIRKKKIKHGIRYIQGKYDLVIQAGPDIQKVSDKREDNVITGLELTAGERFLIEKGMIYCRTLIQERGSNIVRKLKELNILHSFMTEEVSNENSYQKVLANEYPASKTILELLVTEDSSVILHSSFFVLLAQRNIHYFFQFLINLLKVHKIRKAVLCKACLDQMVGDHTVSTIIQTNEEVAFQKDVKFIQQFIDKYRYQQ